MVEEDGDDIVRVVGEDGQPRWGLRGPMTVTELLHDFKRDPELVGIFQAPRAAAPAAPKPTKIMSRQEWQLALASADPDRQIALERYPIQSNRQGFPIERGSDSNCLPER
ncbi:hypothetical protein JDN40_00750, partial [Rhodomicrobium vannielii ATCC 17100]|uniref:hypothetical protein n=1 Tax=Rhodomicrobium vannielii TaxID=1069 RepID=UPI001919D140